MEAIILCGGEGTRMGNQGENLPKCLFKIGEDPILLHIMKHFSSHGVKDFVLCGGYEVNKIKEFIEGYSNPENWKIHVVDTGLKTSKLNRILQVKELIKNDNFFVAYGDDLSDVDLNEVLKLHNEKQSTITITGVRLQSPFGIVSFGEGGKINEFKEKPLINEWMNGGYMVFNKNFFNEELDGELEDDMFPKLASKEKIYLYQHHGSWKSMNTLKDNIELNKLLKGGNAFWIK